MTGSLIFANNRFSNFVFDLDNTLYDEVDYLFFAYRKVSEAVQAETGIDREMLYKFLTDNFKKSGRRNLFDQLCASFDLDRMKWIDMALTILRNTSFEEPISLFPTMRSILIELNQKRKNIFILTNGNVVQQKNKVKSINWPIEIPESHIYYANLYLPKPSPISLQALLKDHSISPGRTVYVGDGTEDELCATACGVRFLKINHAEKGNYLGV